MANVEQMLNNLAEYWTKTLEFIGIYWTEIGQNFGRKKLGKIWEKIFEWE